MSDAARIIDLYRRHGLAWEAPGWTASLPWRRLDRY
ncbi:hypothetical protein FBZ92_115171 [Nitrospirillum viridazoti]|uniref:Uncharacterized protein n=1 Tax=Nitrospirillum amazonense TaxID=28077 RepID=A0A560I627_9PROT|nr:hypothetical protein FBZ92_115171 [Nitrospirillum amazonense]